MEGWEAGRGVAAEQRRAGAVPAVPGAQRRQVGAGALLECWIGSRHPGPCSPEQPAAPWPSPAQRAGRSSRPGEPAGGAQD